MNQQRLFNIYVYVVSVFGLASIIFAVANLDTSGLNTSTLILILGALLITSRLTLSLPRSNSHLSFSDTMIFFSFLFFSGELAILLAVLEISISCFFLKTKGVVFERNALVFNVFSVAMGTAGTLLVWRSLPFLGLTNDYLTTPNLITSLGILAFAQFAFISTLAAGYYSLKRAASFWKTWKIEGFSISMTQIAGAGLAGVAYKLISYSDLVTIGVSLLVLGIAYLNYRQLLRDINESIDQAEKAERDKTEIARAKAEEVEEHAKQLKLLLEKEEDISRDLRQSKQDLEYAAFHDNLTDLPNRAYLIERLNLLLQLGPEVAKRYYVLFLDLSRFKNINDSLGHTVGDEVLRVVALRLRRCLRDEDTIARLGGDEFAIILNDLSSLQEAKSYAYQIYDHLTQPYVIHGNKIFSDLFIGIAPFDYEQLKPEDILRDADIAMHSAKEENVSVAVFDKDVRSKYLEHIRLEGDLRYAIEREELALNYQPLISLKGGEIVGFEALLRWYHSELGFISPGVFIPISEDTGSVIPITKWVLAEACNQLQEWRERSEVFRDLTVSVNISGRHLADRSLVTDIEEALEISGLPATHLKLEITESTAMENAERSIETLNEVSNMGVKLSIDDFGTGYSSLSYLHRLPFDTLKIDRSFVLNVGENGEDSGILQTIVSLTKTLKKEVVAEGIETEKQLELLRDLGCEYGQGYLFSKPLPGDEIETLLYQKTSFLPFADQSSSSDSFEQPATEVPHRYA
ncbi:MAG: phosphodiesterase [Acidobacteria bacterium]|nr:MAG: phosphodiesterase [Acidobacteriota bacterium]REK02271.1 MAG: phosphodiesterase [Acidobacteriota bacterium]REK13926.1 MAG: phosphodiesterase [Acidobacteriota bacterium]REK41920.1 MAG: phosphodiesterase [Acidobacteriota bacterium]